MLKRIPSHMYRHALSALVGLLGWSLLCLSHIDHASARPKSKKHSTRVSRAQLSKRGFGAQTTFDRKQLTRKLNRILRSRKLRGARVGLIVTDRDGHPLYQKNAKKLYIPASNTKIFTIAAALHTLGPQYQYTTKIYGTRPIDKNGVLRGDLYIKGSGDPLLRSEELWRITRDLYNLGLRKITGRVKFDASVFDRKRFGKGWKDHNHERYRPYLAATGGLSMNFNTITITIHPGKVGKKARITIDPPSRYVRKVINLTKTVTSVGRIKAKIRMRGFRNREHIIIRGNIPSSAAPRSYWRRVSHPGWYTAFNLVYFLRQQRIRVNRWPRRSRVPGNAVELHRYVSPLLTTSLQYAGKYSSNFVTEQVLKTMGAEKYNAPGTWKKGLRVVQTFLKKHGIMPKEYTMQNGSGLGRGNRFSPLQIATLLKGMLADLSTRPDFLTVLPVAGKDGTLRNRMLSIKSTLRAKTGTIDGVSSLSGYVQTRDKRMLIFSICMNGKLRQVKLFRRLQNKIGAVLAAYPWKK